MSASPDDGDAERIRDEAAAWFAKMRGPDAAQLEPALAAWRAEHARHDAAYAQLLQRWDQAAFLTNMPLGRTRDLRRAASGWRQPALRYGVAAAGIALAAGIAALAVHQRPGPPPSGTAPVLAQSDRAIRALTLADGSRVTLDASSSIRIAFTPAARRIRLLRGRARFEVAPMAARPFLVETSGGSVTGAAGMVDVGLGPRQVSIIVWRGSFDVAGASAAAAGPARTSRLAAGQQLRFAPGAVLPAPTLARPAALDWTHGMLAFDASRLDEAAAAINHYNDLQIAVAPHIGGLRITGAFRATDPLGFARAAAGLFHLSISRAADGTIILAPEIKA